MPFRFIALLLCSLLSFFGTSQNFDTVCLQQLHVLSTLASQHYSAPKFDATTNAQVLEIFLKEADERSIIFLEQDKEELLKVINTAENTDVHCQLIRQSFSIFKKRLPQIDSVIEELGKRKLEFSAQDTITFSYGKKDRIFCRDMNELTRRIDKRIKYECLLELTAPSTNIGDLRDPELGIAGKLKENARQKSVRRLNHHLKSFRDDQHLVHHLGDCMSNALTRRSDPHSNYFNSRDLQSYNNSIFTEENSFGFTVTEDENGNILIAGLTPGGPAWKSNSLHEKDLILSFRFKDEDEVVVENTGLEDFYRDFERSTSNIVELKVQKKDLKLVTVTLKKEKIQAEENTLNSYVVNFEGKKMGYIPIPSFYLNEEADSRQGLANDVAKEIIELKLDSINGLIIDLRYNGGGSMREAMGLAGIFIDEGPVAIYKPKSGNPFLLKDLNRGLIYDGPLVVLVNSASASASELVTATLQDYNRAVIVGATTFGKGTAQSIVMADSSYYDRNSNREQSAAFGFMKVTGGKFYRVSGQSHQGAGIEPDIKIPGIVERVMEKESAYPYFLSMDSVDKDVSFQQLAPLPKDSLRHMSEQRIASNSRFTEIVAVGDSLQKSRHKSEKIALTLPQIKAYTDKQRRFSSHIEGLFTSSENEQLLISSNSQNGKLLAMMEYYRKNTENTIETLKKDIILQESVNILNDLIALSAKHQP